MPWVQLPAKSCSHRVSTACGKEISTHLLVDVWTLSQVLAVGNLQTMVYQFTGRLCSKERE